MLVACLSFTLCAPGCWSVAKRSQTFDKNNCESHFVILTDLSYVLWLHKKERKLKRRNLRLPSAHSNSLPWVCYSTAAACVDSTQSLSLSFYHCLLYLTFSSRTGKTQTFLRQHWKNMICSQRQLSFFPIHWVVEKTIFLLFLFALFSAPPTLTKFNLLFDDARQRLKTAVNAPRERNKRELIKHNRMFTATCLDGRKLRHELLWGVGRKKKFVFCSFFFISCFSRSLVSLAADIIHKNPCKNSTVRSPRPCKKMTRLTRRRRSGEGKFNVQAKSSFELYNFFLRHFMNKTRVCARLASLVCGWGRFDFAFRWFQGNWRTGTHIYTVWKLSSLVWGRERENRLMFIAFIHSFWPKLVLNKQHTTSPAAARAHRMNIRLREQDITVNWTKKKKKERKTEKYCHFPLLMSLSTLYFRRSHSLCREREAAATFLFTSYNTTFSSFLRYTTNCVPCQALHMEHYFIACDILRIFLPFVSLSLFSTPLLLASSHLVVYKLCGFVYHVCNHK